MRRKPGPSVWVQWLAWAGDYPLTSRQWFQVAWKVRRAHVRRKDQDKIMVFIEEARRGA